MDASSAIPTGSPMTLRLASVYGVQRPAAAARAAAALERASTASGIRSLIGSRVAQGMEFEAPITPGVMAGVTTAGSFHLYRRPADRNAAATGIELGRRVDVRG